MARNMCNIVVDGGGINEAKMMLDRGFAPCCCGSIKVALVIVGWLSMQS